MRCILACDLKGGIVVKGVKGEREKYLPVNLSSRIVNTSSPADLINSIRPKETYIADLDRIMGVGDHLDTIKAMSRMTETMADTGISSVADFELTLGVAGSAVLGTETAPLSVIEQCQGKHTVVSLDMKHGKTMHCDPALDMAPLDVLKLLDGLELNAVILLDIGRVGSGEGIDVPLVTSAASASKHDIIVGGGVRDMADLDLLKTCGASGAIVASAVHDGKIPLELLRA
jgi:phosphoribosylformimino-5-aminoimidazole carboxamide ribotide isomerase